MRIPGFEPGQVAWEATIITTRSYPQIKLNGRINVDNILYAPESFPGMYCMLLQHLFLLL